MRLNLFALALLVAPLPVRAADGPVEAALRRHIAFLASDDLAGRKPGTQGADRAVHYVAEQLAAAGLQPGAPDGGWYAPVPLVERAPGTALVAWSVGGQRYLPGADDQYLLGRDEAVRLIDAPIVYVGYAIDDDASGVHNLLGVDLAGAVAVMHAGRPEGIVPPPPSTAARMAELIRRGAVAVIIAARPADDFAGVLANARNGVTTLAANPAILVEGWMALPAWARITAAAGADAADLLAAAARPDFRARRIEGRVSIDVRTQVRRYSSWNVIGRLPGIDAGHSSVLYLAHWDHLGLCRPPGTPDRICNGAVDNASGVAMLIEVARGLAAAPRPHRSLVFVATAAEEMGLLGANALEQAPPVPVNAIVAAINFDTVAIAPAGEPVGVLGRGLDGPLDAAIDEAAHLANRGVSDSEDSNFLYARQDGYVFSRAGVPSAMAGSAFADMDRLRAFLGGPYHKPNDEAAAVELGGAAEDVAFHVTLGRLLADPARYRGDAGN